MQGIGKYLSSALFCDDVRHEIDRKFSLIGVYSGSALFDEYPVSLKGICIKTDTHCLAQDIPKIIETRVSLGDNIVSYSKADVSLIPIENQEDAEYITMSSLMNFPPLIVHTPCDLCVETNIDGLGWIRAGRLRFKITSDA